MQNRWKNQISMGRQQQIQFFDFFLIFATSSFGLEKAYAY